MAMFASTRMLVVLHECARGGANVFRVSGLVDLISSNVSVSQEAFQLYKLLYCLPRIESAVDCQFDMLQNQQDMLSFIGGEMTHVLESELRDMTVKEVACALMERYFGVGTRRFVIPRLSMKDQIQYMIESKGTTEAFQTLMHDQNPDPQKNQWTFIVLPNDDGYEENENAEQSGLFRARRPRILRKTKPKID
jgi:hypothetical protein